MNEVIDLLDSDDEEPPLKAPSSLSRLNAGNDDDDVEFMGVQPTAAPPSLPKKPSTASSQTSSAAKTPRNPYRAPRVSLETTGVASPSSAPQPKRRPKNPYNQTPRAVSLLSQSTYDSDSSDDSLMNGGPVFSSSKRPSISSAPLKAVGTNPSNADFALAESLMKRPSLALLSRPPSSFSSVTLSPSRIDPPFQYPALLSTSKQYKDLRPNYIIAIWRYARQHTQHSYDRPKLDQLANKIVLLSLTPHPIRSLEEYCYGRGVGGGSGATAADRAKRDEVREKLLQGGLETTVIRPTSPHEPKTYTSIAEACLVAMLNEMERRLEQNSVNPRGLSNMDDTSLQGLLSEKEMWVSLEDLIPAIDALLKPECPARLTRVKDDDYGAAHYTESTTRSAEFLQVKKLETCHKELGDTDKARIKRHTQRRRLYFELTFVGYKSARMVRERQFPLPPNYYRTSRIQRMSQVEDNYKDICVGVDLREGGGGHCALHEMCNILDSKKLPFFVASLKIGDYVFFTRGATGNLDYLCPILVERKSIEDIALSIHDGRWESQKRRMYVGQYVFGYDNSRMVFIVEGKEERQQVTGGYIGHRMYNVPIQSVRDEIENLKSEGFEVLRTPSRQSTMFELSRWALRVAEEMKAGVLNAQYTYADFNEKVKKIPPNTDFSRLAKYAMKSRVETEVASAPAALKRPHVEVDSDIEFVEVLSPMADLKTPAAAPTNPYQKSPLANHKKPSVRTSSDGGSSAKKAKTEIDSGSYEDWTTKQLQEQCVKHGLSKSGKKADLISRLNGPRPPALWLKRKRAKEYVPERHNVAGTALLVALYLHEKEVGVDDRGMTKDELFVKAESLSITKNPFSGGTTQTGPYIYDGWSSMKYLLQGDPALVVKKKGQFRLTRSAELAGYPIAEAMHMWCHEWKNCSCGATKL